MADVHANVPALDAALAGIAAEGCDAVCVIGDVVGSGTHPTESLDRVLHPADRCGVRDNPDSWIAFGQPDPLSQRMGAGAAVHNRREWEHVPCVLRQAGTGWPRTVRIEVAGRQVAFTRDGFDPSGRRDAPSSILPDQTRPTARSLRSRRSASSSAETTSSRRI